MQASRGAEPLPFCEETKAISIEKAHEPPISGCPMTFANGTGCPLEQDESPEQWFLKLFLRCCGKYSVGGQADGTLAPHPISIASI